MQIRNLVKGLWSLPQFMDGDEALPLRYAVVLLFILEKGEVSSTDIQTTLEITQPKVSQILTKLKALGLISTFKGTASRADIAAPTEKGLTLKGVLEDIR